jgi:cardiolipin synthase A/B
MIDAIALFFSSSEPIVAFVFSLNAIFIAFVILLENREPERTLTWLFVLFTFPLIGFIIYLFFGHDWHRRRSYRRLKASYEATRAWKALAERSATPGTLLESDARRIAVSTTGFKTSSGNRVTVLTDGRVKYPRLIAALKEAKTSIDLEYFIFRYDGIGREIIEVLKERARAGVRVRFMVDGYGSLGLGLKAFREMRASGIKATYFAPLITTFSFFKANYRDHRKIVVIDNAIAFTGGINVGDEYLDKSKAGPWRDASVEIRGPAVADLAALFNDAWFRTTGKREQASLSNPEPAGDERVNIVPSGPTTDWYPIREISLALINGARRSIKIESPYFIPDVSILNALVNAALRGVDVAIIFPKRPDTRLLRWVAHTYLGEVVRAGGRAFEYPIGFLHQKVIIVDDEIATIGTCNIDIRSFLLDFEVNVLLSHPVTIEHLLHDYETDLRVSEEARFEEFLNRPLYRRIEESLARLIAPLL